MRSKPDTGRNPSARGADARWFEDLFALIPDVFFRYRFGVSRGFDYLSPGVRAITGHEAASFYADPAFCVRLVAREDRRVLRQIVRARRGLTCTLRLRAADGRVVELELRTVPVTVNRDIVAVEGVARLRAGMSAGERESAPPDPIPQRLAALLLEVHDLLHGHPELRIAERRTSADRRLALGPIALDTDRMTVALDGRPALTTKEVLVLRYFLLRPNRIVTRDQLLQEVWGYQYTGDSRTVDVHVSRLRRKLPPLKDALVTVKHLGYRLDVDEAAIERAS